MNRTVALTLASAVITAALVPATALAVPQPQPSDEAAQPAPAAFTVSTEVLNALNDWREAKEVAVQKQVVAESDAESAAILADAANAANAEAGRLQTDLDNFARNSYILGSPTTTQLIIESENTDIADTLHGLNYVNGVSIDKGQETAVALDIALDTRDNYAMAFGRSIASNADYLSANADIDRKRQKVLDMARAEGPEVYDAILASASVDSTGCPTEVPSSAIIGITESADVYAICQEAIAQAETPQAKAAISWAFTRLGSPYACQGVGRMGAYQFDCSSYVSRAYEEGAGVANSLNNWSPTTHTMLSRSHPVFRPIEDTELKPGDLALYYTCPEGEVCTYNHVVMYVGEVDGIALQLHTNNCGGVANLTPFWGTEDSEFGTYLGARTVIPSDREWRPTVILDDEGNIVTPNFG